MPIPVNNSDVMYYTQLLKGNWKKGATNLSYIMQNPTTAAELINNGNALLVIYGVTDRNSAALADVMEYYGYGDAAITKWLNYWGGWSYSNMTAIAASSTAMNIIAASSTAMNIIVASSTAMTAIAASSTAMTAISLSYVAVAAVWMSPTAIGIVQANSTAYNILITGSNNTVIIGKAVCIMAGLNPDSYANMSAVAASSVAMSAVAASSVARSAITASTTAKNALFNSPLKTTQTKGGGASWATTSIRTGRGWVIQAYFSVSGESGYPILDGTNQSAATNTPTTVRYDLWFVSSMSMYWYGTASTVTYIPC
jgi:hypothetical protein